DENSRRYFRFLNRLCKCSKVEDFSTMAQTEDACRAHEQDEQAGGDVIPGAQVGRTLAPAIEDQQLMADQRGLGNHGPQSPWPCQSDQGDDHMDQQANEVAHPGNNINTSKPAAFRLKFGNSPWTGRNVSARFRKQLNRKPY